MILKNANKYFFYNYSTCLTYVWINLHLTSIIVVTMHSKYRRKEYHVLRFNAMQSGGNLLILWKNLLPPRSESNCMSRGKILARYRDRRRGHSSVSDQWETVEPKGDRTTKTRPKGTLMFEGETSTFKFLFSNALRKHY